MKQRLMPKSIFYALSVLFVGLALSGVWVTWRAQVENYHVGLAVDQILRVVARAREVRFSETADSHKVQNMLIRRLAEVDGMQSRQIERSDKKGVYYALVNPWDDVLNLILTPSKHELRLVMPVSSHHCRRILEFYTYDTGSLGIKRVDVMPDSSFELWRLVYDGRAKNAGNMKKDQIRLHCGYGENAAISLIFQLP